MEFKRVNILTICCCLCLSLSAQSVTGLPDPQEDHAVIMAKFAYECKHKMNNLTQTLERELGPDTGTSVGTKDVLEFVSFGIVRDGTIRKSIYQPRLPPLFIGDLKMRFGLHSGPVTAGVLRG